MITEKKAIEGETVEMWPGFLAMSKLCNDGIFLNVDTATKFINK